MYEQTRDEIVRDWNAALGGVITASADPTVTLAALEASYAHFTQAAYQRTGEAPYWTLISQDERDKAAKSGAALPDGCLAGETMVATQEGPRRIDSLVGPATLLTDEGWVDAEVRSFGVKELRVVILRRGAEERLVFATPNHRWFVYDHLGPAWTTTDDLGLSPCVVPHVAQVGQDSGYPDGLSPSDHRVAPVAEQPSDAPGDVVMVDVEGGPLPARSGVATASCGFALAEGAFAFLRIQHGGKLRIPDSVLPAQDPLSAGEPAGVTDDDLVGALLSPIPDAELALGSAVAVAGRKVGVGTLDATDTANDGANIVDRLSDRAHGPDPIQCWRVVAVMATRRVEEVFCAVVPGLHRFVLAGGILTGNSYPITACEGENSVDTAIHAVGRGGADHDHIRAHIIKRAASLSCPEKIPDNWNSDGSLKAASGDAVAAVTELHDRLVIPAEALGIDGKGELVQMAPPPPPPAHEPPAAPGAPPAAPPADKAPPKPPTPPDAKAKPDGADEADATVTAKIDSAKTAVADAVAAQKADPDNATDPKDAKVLAGLEQVAAILESVTTDQAADSDETKPKPPEKPEVAPDAKAPPAPGETTPPAQAPPAVTAAGPPPAPARQEAPSDTPGNANGIPGDGDDSPPSPGDIEADVQCENPDCEHMSQGHEDTDDGQNTGHCTMAGCGCPGMVVSGSQVVGPGDSEDGAPPAEDADKMADAPPTVAPSVEGAPAPELPPLNPLPTAVVGPDFSIPVMWLENVPTGDGRIIEPGAITWRTPPLPLMGLKTSPHDPSGMSPNDPAVLIGRIEEIVVDGTTGTAKGHLLATPEGSEWALILEQMGRMGVSVDVGAAEVQVTADTTQPPSPDIFDIPLIEKLTAGEVMGATVCPFAAFAGAYIVLGDGSNAPEAELPPAPAGAKMALHLVDAEECEPCTAGTQPLVASGSTITPIRRAGPLAPPAAWFEDPVFSVGDGRLREIIDVKTGRGSGKFGCPTTVTEDGEVFGHVALWGLCHQSPQYVNQGQCVMAPRSHTGYAMFHTGSVRTAEGELIDVGRLTADAGHADDHLSMARTIAHYDNSAVTAALVRAGEDEFGIWFHGSVHPAASEEQIVTLRANPPSGDWRPHGIGQEMVAALCVNTPGFPMARATLRDGRVLSLVAAGFPLFERQRPAPSVEDELAALRRLVVPSAAARARQDMAALRGS